MLPSRADPPWRQEGPCLQVGRSNEVQQQGALMELRNSIANCRFRESTLEAKLSSGRSACDSQANGCKRVRMDRACHWLGTG